MTERDEKEKPTNNFLAYIQGHDAGLNDNLRTNPYVDLDDWIAWDIGHQAGKYGRVELNNP